MKVMFWSVKQIGYLIGSIVMAVACLFGFVALGAGLVYRKFAK